jgi:gas vesicle protein
MSDSNSEVKLAVGFILGMVTGLAIGFILTPKSGWETRELLIEKVANTGDKVKEIADDIDGMVKEVVGDREKIYKKAWNQPKVKPYIEEL